MELTIYLEDAVKNFSRYNKYSTGAELRELSRKIILLIIRANSTQKKEAVLHELVIHCDMLKVYRIKKGICT